MFFQTNWWYWTSDLTLQCDVRWQHSRRSDSSGRSGSDLLQGRGQNENPLTQRPQKGRSPKVRLLLQLLHTGICKYSQFVFVQSLIVYGSEEYISPKTFHDQWYFVSQLMWASKAMFYFCLLRSLIFFGKISRINSKIDVVISDQLKAFLPANTGSHIYSFCSRISFLMPGPTA